MCNTKRLEINPDTINETILQEFKPKAYNQKLYIGAYNGVYNSDNTYVHNLP